MAAPLVSIILPTRNRLDTIRRTVERILAQDFTDWELVISDNASDQEGKAAYLEELAKTEARIKIHLQPQNIGIHANWVFCIHQCQGRYYIPVTDDDWWGEESYLSQLLALHDGCTGSVFPNMCIHHLDTGEILHGALTAVYGSIRDKYELCYKLVTDGRGVIMVGLIDMEVIPRSEIISVLDNGLSIALETVGMNRLAREYPVRFCEGAHYHHTAYSGNYFRGIDSDIVSRDRGIATFRLLDDLRLAAARDEGYAPALAAQWDKAQLYCDNVAQTRLPAAGQLEKKLAKLKEELGQAQRDLKQAKKAHGKDVSSLSKAIRSWWKQRTTKGQ
jgi:glycosyltransferase involved in cell wall biosynthesis